MIAAHARLTADMDVAPHHKERQVGVKSHIIQPKAVTCWGRDLIFPFGLNGSVGLRRVRASVDSTQAVVRRIEDMLDNASATTVWTEEHTIHFTAGAFRMVWSWNVLAPFGSGRIRVDASSGHLVVRYHLSTTEMFVIVTAMLGIFSIITWTDLQNFQLHIVPFLIGGWLWLFGMNYLIAAIRFPIWLRSGLGRISES